MYESDLEQVEALKKWWKENGRTVIFGLLLGAGGVVGWTSWRTYTHSREEHASMIYEQLLGSSGSQAASKAVKAAGALLEDMPGSGYAALSALVLADQAHAGKQPAEAQRLLTWVLDHSDDQGLRLVARLRLARLLLEGKNYDGALALLDNVEAGPFAAAFDEVRGDVQHARGKAGAARTAYSQALQAMTAGDPDRDRLRMKLDDLGVASAAAGGDTAGDPSQ